jgi:drug/metabolite transporter (DMT)-like permease
LKTALYTAFALFAFALNSILCRMALWGGEADAASFTAVRLISGAVALVLISAAFGNAKAAPKSGSWPSAFLIVSYAICFSLAYLGLTVATGALILFGSVQLTMIVMTLAKGERPSVLEWTGLAVAAGGLVYLVLPGLESPPLVSSLLMTAAGASWAVYTLRGKGEAYPLAATTGNFVRSLPFLIPVLPFFLGELRITAAGAFLAILSGALASGVGYAVWYTALKGLTSTRAAVLQLSVPVIAAVLAVVMLNEILTMRLLIAGLTILGGIAITIAGRKPADAGA